MWLQFLAPVLVASLILLPYYTNGDWNNVNSNQYHIQTDEGPERYFRYQTESGQYRKEKRLEDGTVVGSYGWIDSNGFLRLRDYIADNAGYRILRTKNVFVGRNRPISQAIKVAKKVPSQGGLLSSTNDYLPPKTNYISNEPAFISQVDINHNAFPSSTVSPILSSTERPPYISTTLAPPLSQTISTPHSDFISSTPPTVVISQKPPGYSSTPASVLIAHSTTPTYIQPEEYPSSTPYYVSRKPTETYISSTPYPSSTLIPPLHSNSLDYYETHDNPYRYHNGPTYPIDRHGNVFLGYNHIGNGYDPQYPKYDGVSVTNDGFRYYIPRAYHEEQNLGNQDKSGSFGYIDPFGIRRVVYYNANSNGFQHRKNNRYVGFDATPYDPRPI